MTVPEIRDMKVTEPRAGEYVCQGQDNVARAY